MARRAFSNHEAGGRRVLVAAAIFLEKPIFEGSGEQIEITMNLPSLSSLPPSLYTRRTFRHLGFRPRLRFWVASTARGNRVYDFEGDREVEDLKVRSPRGRGMKLG